MSLRRKNNMDDLIVLTVGHQNAVFSRTRRRWRSYYSTGFYPVIARGQRLLFGWIPFSVGDLLYAAVVVWLSVPVGKRGIRRLVRREAGRGWLLRGCWAAVFVLLWVYVLFNGRGA
jgi:hypothetical protein